MRTLLILSLTSLAIGCGDDGLEYATPTGLVAGEVRDGVSGTFVSGAAITLWTGDEVHETTTRNDGRFEIDELPSGSTLWLDVAKEGYATERHFIDIDDAAGHEPQNNSLYLVDADLYPDSNDVTVTIKMGVDAVSPGPGVEIQARGMGSGFEFLDILVGVTDGSGSATIQRIATWQSYELRVLPFEFQGETYTGTASYSNGTPADKLDIAIY